MDRSRKVQSRRPQPCRHKAKQQRREERQSQLAGTKELHLRLNREKKPRKELHFASQRGVVPGYIKSPSFLYRMVRSVGRGSFGDAILIERVDSPGTLYVMKQMDAVRLSAKDKIACFNEIRILASLHHPFVVRYLESFCTEQKVCLVMDYCAGGDLQSFLKDLRKKEALLAPTDVFRLFSQLVLGLKYLHDRRVLHRGGVWALIH
ncbi:MAG: uncharacterized protein KVP18_003479 [Porospora cf. gigantea A]|uniref:uncharacterized protein n=1 Tax=Porospora cf. gigantea A TaxID=2853593 RepID=UPI003559BB1B|nr:MAG: hypothetical protein KVP18_003479 [Porospora cf. gigantea A]